MIIMKKETVISLICLLIFINSCKSESSFKTLIYGNWNIIKITDKKADNSFYDKEVRFPAMYIEKKFKLITIEIYRNEDFFSNFKIFKENEAWFLKMNNSSMKKFDGKYKIYFKMEESLGPGDILILESKSIKIEAIRKGFR